MLAGLLLAGAACTKVEGLIVAVPAICAFLVWNCGRGGLAAALRLSLPPVISLGTWFLFGNVNGIFRGYASYQPLTDARWRSLPLVIHSILVTLGS